MQIKLVNRVWKLFMLDPIYTHYCLINLLGYRALYKHNLSKVNTQPKVARLLGISVLPHLIRASIHNKNPGIHLL
jgi:hypothetical protein